MDKKAVIVAGVFVAAVFIGIFIFKNNKGQIEARPTPTSAEAKKIYSQAQAYLNDNELGKAKEMYQQLLTNYPDFEKVETIQKELEKLNMKIITGNFESPQSVLHQVQSGDSLVKIAKKYNTTIELIKKQNNLKSDIIRVGQKLRIWQGNFNVFVDKSQNILILKNGGEVIKVYRVSTGSNNSTPIGTFKVVNKLVDPVWFNRGVIVPPESPENVLGSRWLGFDIPGYGIHGTVEPETIGQQVTAGCVRMRNEEVEELYDLLVPGTEVTIVD